MSYVTHVSTKPVSCRSIPLSKPHTYNAVIKYAIITKFTEMFNKNTTQGNLSALTNVASFNMHQYIPITYLLEV